MCDNAVLEIGILESVRDCYKTQQMYNKAVDNYLHALEFVRECYKAQGIGDKAVDTDLPYQYQQLYHQSYKLS